jgi:phage/plasmid-associated DNA primase
VLSQFNGQNIGQYNCAVVLFKEFYFDTLKSHFGTLKRLMEGKRFSADVKCKDPVTVQFDCPNIFVSNEHPSGDKSFLKRIHFICADRA